MLIYILSWTRLDSVLESESTLYFDLDTNPACHWVTLFAFLGLQSTNWISETFRTVNVFQRFTANLLQSHAELNWIFVQI